VHHPGYAALCRYWLEGKGDSQRAGSTFVCVILMFVLVCLTDSLISMPRSLQAIRTRSSHYQAYGFLPTLQNYLLEKHGLGSDSIATYTGPQKQSVRMGIGQCLPRIGGQSMWVLQCVFSCLTILFVASLQ
jgi:hypothetical protein